MRDQRGRWGRPGVQQAAALALAALLALAAWQGWWWWFHRRLLMTPWFLVPCAVSGVGAVAAMEAGWVVAEVGRQPWIARGLLRTNDAVTVAPGLDLQFYGFSLIYVILAATCWWLLRRVGRTPAAVEGE